MSWTPPLRLAREEDAVPEVLGAFDFGILIDGCRVTDRGMCQSIPESSKAAQLSISNKKADVLKLNEIGW